MADFVNMFREQQKEELRELIRKNREEQERYEDDIDKRRELFAEYAKLMDAFIYVLDKENEERERRGKREAVRLLN